MLKRGLILVFLITIITTFGGNHIFSADELSDVAKSSGETGNIEWSIDTMYTASAAVDKMPRTFEATIKVDSSVSRGGVILGNCKGATYDDCTSFEIYESGHPRLYLVQNGRPYNFLFETVDVRVNEYVHVAIVIDGDNIHCYLNGELKETKDYTASDVIPNNIFAVGGDFRSGSAQYFKGDIKSLSLYADARTAAEILDDVNKIDDSDSELLMSYDLEGKANEMTIEDDSPNDNDLKTTWFSSYEEPEDYAYSFMIVGDIQVITEADDLKGTSYVAGIIDYILENVEKKKVEHVLFLGDLTDNCNDTEWAIVKEQIARLDGKVAYSLIAGNHDLLCEGCFLETFNSVSPYTKQYIYNYNGSRNTVHEITTDNVDYLVFALDYGPSDEVMAWAEEIIKSNPNHNVIISTHGYMDYDGELITPSYSVAPSGTGGYNDGIDIWEKLVKKHSNISMVFCGHCANENILIRQDEGDNGNIVTQVLVDPQGMDASIKYVGMVSTMYFSEDGQTASFDWYSTIKDKYYKEVNHRAINLHVVEKKGYYGLTIENDFEKGEVETIDFHPVGGVSPNTELNISVTPQSGYEIRRITFNGTKISKNDTGIYSVTTGEGDNIFTVEYYDVSDRTLCTIIIVSGIVVIIGAVAVFVVMKKKKDTRKS